MKLRTSVVLYFIVCLSVYGDAFSADLSSQGSLPILFSVNVNGELEQCG